MIQTRSDKRCCGHGTNALTVGVAFAVVVTITLICFAPDLGNSLLDWDDAGYITENTHIHSLSLKTVWWAFSSFYLNYWAPLTWLSLALDYAVWGLNPVGYHLTNNILHAFNAGLFFLICMELLAIRSPGFLRVNEDAPFLHIRSQLLCAVLAALFFAIHPLRVESVAWATERKDVLSLFFGLPAVLFYLRHSRSSASAAMSPDYWLSLLLFTLSLLSKSMMVTLPVVLLVLDWFPLKRLQPSCIAATLTEKAPFFILSGAASLLTVKAQADMLASSDHITMFTRLLNAFNSIWAYLQLTVWPLNLSPFYVHPVSIMHLTPGNVLPIVFFVVVTICCVMTFRRVPVFMAVWLIYLVTLLPFLGITQSGPQAMAGRFTYLAGLPLALLFSLGVMYIVMRLRGSPAATVTLGSTVTVLLLACGYLTVREIAFWKDDVTLWTRVIEMSPDTGRAYFQRSYAYRLKHDYQHALADIERAIAIAARKNYRAMHELYWKRAAIRLDMGEYANAVTDYTRALESVADSSRAMILYERGLARQKLGSTDLANEDFRMSEMVVRSR
ncbi:MAG: tetratricopeptide repeat protein [Deltaproteobacteria bacterium]|nr:tetratricopeptide repeat protein [Deltaproteobacteria bacterium]